MTMLRGSSRGCISLLLCAVCLLGAWQSPGRAAASSRMNVRPAPAPLLLPGKPKPVKHPAGSPPGGRSPGIATACVSHGSDRLYAANPGDSRALLTRIYLTYVKHALAVYDQHLPALTIPICVTYPRQFKGTTQTGFGAYNASNGTSGTAASCSITVNPADQSGGKPDPTALPGIKYRLAFRTFECEEAVMAGLDAYYHPPYKNDWVHWGMGEWATAHVAPDPGIKRFWDQYLTRPRVPLTSMDFPAIGFYAHLAESGIDPWSVMRSMLGAGDDRGAFTAAIQSNPDRFLDSWASSYFREPSRGSAWDTTGPGMPSHGPSLAQEVNVGGLDVVKEDVQPYAEALYLVHVKSDAQLLAVSSEVRARVSDGTVDDVLGPTAGKRNQVYCVDPAGCQCPAGTTWDLPSKPPVLLHSRDVAIAFTGGADGQRAGFYGDEMRNNCKPSTCSIGPPGTRSFDGLPALAGRRGESAGAPFRPLADTCVPDDCLLGTWSLTSVTDALSWEVAQAKVPMKFTRSSGAESMTVRPDGTASLTAGSFQLFFRTDKGETVSLTQNGTATASWSSVQASTVQFKITDLGTFTNNFSRGGTTLPDNWIPIATPWGWERPQPYTCSDSTLQLQPVIPAFGSTSGADASGPAMIFTRSQ